MNPRLPWLLLYVLVNIIACAIMLHSNELIGDMLGRVLHSKSILIFATLLVVLSYILLLGPVFSFISSIRITQINFGKTETMIGGRVGTLLIVLQLSFMAFNFLTGVNIAGANSIKTDNFLSFFWIMMPVDLLFVFYYGFYRENRLFYPNVLIWLISNLMRGWAGVFLFVIFFEWCRAVRNNKITLGRATFAGIIVLIFYPLLTNIKWLFRASATMGMSFAELITGASNIFIGQDYFSLVSDGVMHIIGRLQLTSIVVEVMRITEQLQVDFASDKFSPFWKEGLHGIILDRLFSTEKALPIGVAFTQYGDFNWEFDIGNWNTNIGYVGWFFIAPYLTPLYIAYTLFLGFLSFYLVKKIGISNSSEDMLWLAWLAYLLPPWLGAFVNFVYALFIFLLIKIIATRFPKISLLPR